MTPEEYTQLKAFARIDGAYLGLAWIASFALYIGGLSSPALGLGSALLAVLSPVFAAVRLAKFRDKAREGVISFRRAAAYYILMFLYASLLMALAQYIYFAYIDGGYIVQAYSAIMSPPEATAMLKAYGMSGQQLQESINLLAQTEPIYIVLNILSMNVTCGIILSLPVAAIMKRSATNGSNQHPTNS